MSNRGMGVKRFWFGIDTSDASSCWIWTKTKTLQGYGVLRCNIKRKLAHRVAWELANGQEIPDGMQIDHTCHTKLCVNPAHLRICTPAQNSMNHFVRKDSSSGLRGVQENGKKWMASVRLNGKTYYLGVFSTKEEAHAAYCAKAKEIHGEFFNGGFRELH